MLKLKSLIFNDWAVFLLIILPLSFSLVMIVLYITEIYQEGYKYSFSTILNILFILSMALITWPFVIWWYYKILRITKNGVVLSADLIKELGADMLIVMYINVEYTFEYNGVKYDHHASFVPNKKMRKLAKKKYIDIYFDPASKVSIVKEVLR